ncbi:MAG: glycosyltransferase family 39 protein [Anaerolineae bacterium]|nr:glycosyltransferase family 39 protein [Anaerolineae bacterium]
MKQSTNWGMLGVLLLAAVCRLWMLPATPLGLHYDEAANVILTRQIAEQGYRPLFIRAYTGKEVAFFYVSALWMKVTGGQVWSVRLSSAMLGILTIAATYAMVRALFPGVKSRGIALYASAGMAVAFPHLILSRYGFRAITQPLLQALAVAALWRGWRSGRAGWLVAGGVLTGLTGYTYLAARLFPIPLAISLSTLWPGSSKAQRQPFIRAFLLFALSAALTFSPLGIFFLLNPDAFITRITQVAAPSLAEALRGIGQCLLALFVPGAGDPYIRFNLPGRPVLDVVSALLAGIGWIAILGTRMRERYHRAGRILVLTATAVMLLPSALATAEITPSHLRMVGVYPFLAVLPAVGLHWLVSKLPDKRFAALAPGLLFLVLGWMTGTTYAQWAHSSELFYAADGEMVLAAQAADAYAGEATTIAIASEHYRHPTVAALSSTFSQVKWLTGGASYVLPQNGSLVTILPNSMQPPIPWPTNISNRAGETWLPDPYGAPAVLVQRLESSAIAALRQPGKLIPAAKPAADFAHVTAVHALAPAEPCEAGRPCTVRLIWEVLASYPALQPQVRVSHPTSGQWARATPFHYPAEQWTPGDLVLDYIQLNLPASMPPGYNYQLAVNMVDTVQQSWLPRLEQELFAGLEYSVPAAEGEPWPLPARVPLSATQTAQACTGIPREHPIDLGPLRLLGWLLPTKPDPFSAQAMPGELLLVSLCWEVAGNAGALKQLSLVLETGDETILLYAGEPAEGYGFAQWQPGAIIEDRYAVRLPRDLAPSAATLHLRLDTTSPVTLTQLTVEPVLHTYTAPQMDNTTHTMFGNKIQLLGYDLELQPAGESVTFTLYWQARETMEQDYVVFVHLVDTESGETLAQVDEQPQQGQRPTSSWRQGEVIADSHVLEWPAKIQWGTAALRTGLYIPVTGTYLLSNGAREVTLGAVTREP